MTAIVVLPVAFCFAYALHRSSIPLKWVFRAVALIPVLAPSLQPALALIYLCGNQGFPRPLIGGAIYTTLARVAVRLDRYLADLHELRAGVCRRPLFVGMLARRVAMLVRLLAVMVC